MGVLKGFFERLETPIEEWERWNREEKEAREKRKAEGKYFTYCLLLRCLNCRHTKKHEIEKGYSYESVETKCENCGCCRWIN